MEGLATASPDPLARRSQPAIVRSRTRFAQCTPEETWLNNSACGGACGPNVFGAPSRNTGTESRPPRRPGGHATSLKGKREKRGLSDPQQRVMYRRTGVAWGLRVCGWRGHARWNDYRARSATADYGHRGIQMVSIASMHADGQAHSHQGWPRASAQLEGMADVPCPLHSILGVDPSRVSIPPRWLGRAM